MNTAPSQPQLDAHIAPFSLTPAGGGDPVPIDALIEHGPAVLAMVQGGTTDDSLAAMLRELGDRMRSAPGCLVVVTTGRCEMARQLDVVRAARWLTDPEGDAKRALGLKDGRKLRRKRREGLFIVDQGRVLRFAFVAQSAGQWIPASFVSSRLGRLAASCRNDEAAVPAEWPPADLQPAAAATQSDMDSLVRELGQALGLGGTALTQLSTASRFRDLGMTAVPDEIINKVEPLDESEWEIVRSHPQRSAEMLGESPLFEQVRAIVRATHEHYDGSGYPDGLAGDWIPLGARVILVAESYLALAAIGDADPLTELHAHAGRYDPAVLSALAGVISDAGGSPVARTV